MFETIYQRLIDFLFLNKFKIWRFERIILNISIVFLFRSALLFWKFITIKSNFSKSLANISLLTCENNDFSEIFCYTLIVKHFSFHRLIITYSYCSNKKRKRRSQKGLTEKRSYGGQLVPILFPFGYLPSPFSLFCLSVSIWQLWQPNRKFEIGPWPLF